MAVKMMPGSAFPTLTLQRAGGGKVTTATDNGRYKLIVVLRGSFCPFCRGTAAHVQSKLAELEAASIDVLVISADTAAESEPWLKEHGVTFPLGYGLTDAQMKELCVYVSEPKDYQPQFSHRFSEPAWFFLRPDGVVKYIDVASMPMGGRVNVDNLLAGHTWVLGEAARNPPFEKVVFGAAMV